MKAVYFNGIGGSRLSGLAGIYKSLGYQVFGSDNVSTSVTDHLKDMGITVFIPQSKKNVLNVLARNKIELVINSQAIPLTNVEYKEFQKANIPMAIDAYAIGKLTKKFKTIGIAGTQGKTTTTGILSKIFIDLDLDPLVLIGSNASFLNNESYRVANNMNSSPYFIIESCEYKDSFLNYDFEYLLIPAITYDHHDYFKTQEQYFTSFAKAVLNTQKAIIVDKNDKNIQRVLEIAANINNSNIPQIVDWRENLEIIKKFNLYLKTQFLYEDCAVAYTLAKFLNLNLNLVQKSMEDYRGVGRRFEVKKVLFQSPKKTTIISDYAHTPDKIKYCLTALSDTYPNCSALIIWQPHQYARTIALCNDFIDVFAKYSSKNWQFWITDIYESRDTEEDKKKINSSIIVERLKERTNSSRFIYSGNIKKTKDLLANSCIQQYDVVLIIGAGNIEDIIK